MDTKKVVGAVVILVAVVGVLVVFVGLPAAQTSFHYERQYASSETRYVLLQIDEFDTTPTDISIKFVDDPSLMYSIDIEQYEPGSHHFVRLTEFEDLLTLQVQGSGGQQISGVDITLGTGTYYVLSIRGQLLDVVITYDNGAIIAGQDVGLQCFNSSTLEFIFTENVNFTSSGLSIRTGLEVDVELDIDLPDGMNGLLTVPTSTSFSYTSLVGWFHHSSPGSNTYETASTVAPLLDFSHENQGTISGSLLD